MTERPDNIYPTKAQIKELYEAWEKGNLLEVLRERDREALLDPNHHASQSQAPPSKGRES
jgi:vacuolar-type H+-ATPase subunit E/Vma4